MKQSKWMGAILLLMAAGIMAGMVLNNGTYGLADDHLMIVTLAVCGMVLLRQQGRWPDGPAQFGKLSGASFGWADGVGKHLTR